MKELPETFDEWVENFGEWQKIVGFDPAWAGDFELSIKFDWERAGEVIEFGDYAGRPKWERSLQVPHQNIRDSLVSMITVQGDTEFASVEQQIFQNSNLEKLLNLQETNQISQMVDFIGNRVEYFGQELSLEKGNAEFSYVMPSGVVDANVNISNSTGLNVFFAKGDTTVGKHTVVWDGVDKNEIQLSDGKWVSDLKLLFLP